jgi:hypothetical protein
MSYFRRVVAAYDKIDCITPADQPPEDRAQELKLFAILNGLPQDDPLRVSLIAQGALTLNGISAAMLRIDTGKKLAEAGTEQAHAAQGGSCWTCGEKDHLSRDCLHREAVQQLITKRKNAGGGTHKSNNSNNNNNNNNKGKGKGTAAAAATDAAAASSTPKPQSQDTESAGVATSFLSDGSHVTHTWLCDTGASSTMSGDRSVFRCLMPDRRPIRLADGKVIYLKGLGSIHFLSTSGYTIIIDDV